MRVYFDIEFSEIDSEVIGTLAFDVYCLCFNDGELQISANADYDSSFNDLAPNTIAGRFKGADIMWVDEDEDERELDSDDFDQIELAAAFEDAKLTAAVIECTETCKDALRKARLERAGVTLCIGEKELNFEEKTIELVMD